MDEGSRVEEGFWEKIFGSEDVLPVFGFLKTYFEMITNLNVYVRNDDDDKDDFEYHSRDNMIAQFKQDLYNKISVFKKDQGKGDKNDTLQKRINYCPNVIEWDGPIPNKILHYDYNDPGMNTYIRWEEKCPNIREYKRNLRDY